MVAMVHSAGRKGNMGEQMPDGVTIREMRQADLGEVAELERQIFSRPWSEESFRNALSSPDHCYLVAVCGESIVGYCGLWCSFDTADLCNLAMAEEFRKQNLGSALLRHGLAAVQRKGVERVLLEVRCSNAPAIALYAKFGFEELGIRRGYYSYPAEDGILMEISLML